MQAITAAASAPFRFTTMRALAHIIAAGATFSTPPWQVDHFLLYESRQTKQGSVYSELARYDL